ncbi:nitroreductase family protein [Bacteroides sp. 214]|uniref:nitroreductase family protein n=1 Tax=Bacteroides sp. 214 TaxID=2302935 RepID=UPI0013D581BE|nr:nitroreductase family protein [Bacteroides sp. 214]NDW12089.1 nitroreductase family protein [Bacteroides sp. 214]
MKKSFMEVMRDRRTYYAISNQSPISDNEIENILKSVITYVPSAFNSQSARMVLLLGDNHTKLWNIVKETLRKIVPANNFAATEAKIDNSFACGYGTVLFFEDMNVVEGLQKSFPSYAETFPGWSLQSSGMHQFATWSLLEEAGFGASLQHYNPLVDEEVCNTWKFPKTWKLISQMPFGIPVAQPGEKEVQDIATRFFVFK